MAAISELIRTEADGTISFGDYTLGAKAKLDNYEFHGDMYKVNVPGSTIFGGSFAGCVIEIDQTKALVIALAPLKLIQQ